MEVGPQPHDRDGLLGPNSMMVAYVDPLEYVAFQTKTEMNKVELRKLQALQASDFKGLGRVGPLGLVWCIGVDRALIGFKVFLGLVCFRAYRVLGLVCFRAYRVQGLRFKARVRATFARPRAARALLTGQALHLKTAAALHRGLLCAGSVPPETCFSASFSTRWPRHRESAPRSM